ncbi:hypothetical protein D7217_06115 [Legionella pneumophila]|uniref:hypothetical protein n=1 Tax=Legionella pneumophila TaxID=446 RepID=UPI00101FCBFA|nr:hypothetical protein [Legionella pneumophila]RYW92016.1 hypothetical protein D7217_06115 [Legionella pneumophila]HAT1775833.1 hypothetical protein [Legionella pneumophila]HAT1778289.1 hypothetical protein [Legionella pneumophila]HAT2018667.1 hypothetical protein [Legionella pneumophila]HAT2024596.1 hypothetical protein [Legionella pneumophila]
MSYTYEYYKRAYFGDLYELTVEEAAKKIYEGLWHADLASVEEIEEAIIEDIERGVLKLVRGTTRVFNGFLTNPAILNAFDLSTWAESNGLELESNGAWNDYLCEEAELDSFLNDKLESLRALQQSEKSVSEILHTTELLNENMQDQLITLSSENEKLREQLEELTGNNQINENSKMMTSIFKLLSTMAIDGYGFNSSDKKSPVPAEIAKAMTEKLGESMDVGTVRKWLKYSCDLHQPIKR